MHWKKTVYFQYTEHMQSKLVWRGIQFARASLGLATLMLISPDAILTGVYLQGFAW